MKVALGTGVTVQGLKLGSGRAGGAVPTVLSHLAIRGVV